MQKVLIYRNEVLPISETFICSQAAAVKEFEMHFGGLGPPRGPSLSGLAGGSPILLTNDHSLGSRLRRVLFRQIGCFGGTLVRRLSSFQLSLIHAHFAIDGVDALRLAEALHVPLVTTLHGYDVTTRDDVFSRSLHGRLYLRRRERLWERTSLFFASCAYIKERAIAAGFPQHKIEVLYSGHDPLKFRLPVQARDSNLIVYLGRLVEKKGGPYLIRAAALASQKHPALHLVIIGEGPLREEMERLAKELKVNCTFLGRLLDPEPGNTVLDWLARARIFCMPSITASDGNTEGQPAVFVEAHALGTPAVSFRSAGIGEAVLDGETGYLVPEKDVPALAEKIVTLLTDDEIWSRFSRRARTWVWERFDRTALNEQLESSYRRVIDSHRA